VTNLGIKIPGIHIQDQQIPMTTIRNNGEIRNETENAINKRQCTIYIYICVCGDLPTNKSQGELKGNFTCKPREAI
jgi:hypothetical protein